MPETIVAQPAQEVTSPAQAIPPAQGAVAQPKTPEIDLVTRVSQVEVKPKTQENKPEEGKFNINDLDSQIESIQDPALKGQFVEFKKSLLRGENQKYQEIANLRKTYEQKLVEATTWTPERIKQEMSRPDFVQAANAVLQSQAPQGSGISNEQWSALSESEKAEFAQLKQKINTLEQTNWEATRMQQDMNLRTKYANYNPQTIDQLTNDLVQGRIQATREDLWKVYDYENAVNRAYQLGLQDKVNLNQERANGMTMTGGGNMPQPSTLERQKGESVSDFMRRSYQEHIKKK